MRHVNFILISRKLVRWAITKVVQILWASNVLNMNTLLLDLLFVKVMW